MEEKQILACKTHFLASCTWQFLLKLGDAELVGRAWQSEAKLVCNIIIIVPLLFSH